MSKVLPFAHCSQMSNPQDGTGHGGNRCTEACAAMIDVSFKISADAKAGASAQTIMYNWTKKLNGGSTESTPKSGSWITAWLAANGIVMSPDTPTWQAIVNCIDRGHVAMGGFNNYFALRLANGSNPYKWDSAPIGEGHVLMIVGYDSESHSVIVNDPLRGEASGQPAAYSFASFQKALFKGLFEIQKPVGGGSNTQTTIGNKPCDGAGANTQACADCLVQNVLNPGACSSNVTITNTPCTQCGAKPDCCYPDGCISGVCVPGAGQLQLLPDWLLHPDWNRILKIGLGVIGLVVAVVIAFWPDMKQSVTVASKAVAAAA